MARRFTYNRSSSPSLSTHNLLQFSDEFAAAAIPGTGTIANPGTTLARASYEIFSDGSTLTVGVSRDTVQKSDVDALVIAHVADPEYGKFVPVTRDAIIAMDAATFRTFVATKLQEFPEFRP